MSTNYELMNKQLLSLSESSRNYIPLMSNISALLFENMKDINWAGFYLVKNDNLLLGPFQGKVACVNIEKGKGVCGTSLKEDKTIVVENVHEFIGHIACDSASNSEIVIPIHYNNEIRAVLDIDSPLINRFSIEDKDNLEEFVRNIEKVIEFD